MSYGQSMSPPRSGRPSITDSAGTRLAIHIGNLVTVAAVDRHGHRTPVVFGDMLTIATPTIEDGRDLMTALFTTRGDAAEPVIAAVADHLRVVVAHAGSADEVLLAVPPPWEPRHREMITQAAWRAGLDTVQVISEAAAVVARTVPDASENAMVLVCQLGQRTSQVTVVQKRRSRWVRVATQPIRVTGDLLDHALAQRLGLDTPVTDMMPADLADARRMLNAGRPAAITIAGHPAPLSLSPADLNDAARPLCQIVEKAVVDVLDAAGVDGHRLHTTVVHDECADVLFPSGQAAKRLGIGVTAATDGRLTTVYGAFDTTGGWDRPSTLGGMTLRAGWEQWGSQLVAPMACITAGTVLLWQIIQAANRSLPPQSHRLPIDYEKLSVYFDGAGFALAGWTLTLACLAVGRSLSVALLAVGARVNAGKAYAISGLVGLAITILQGLLAQAVVEGPAPYAPPYLYLAAAGAAVPAAIAMTIGMCASRLHGRPSWTYQVHFPVWSAILAVGGIVAVNISAAGLHIGGAPRTASSALSVIGSGLLGVAIALALVTTPAARMIFAPLMSAACMVVVSSANARSATTVYLVTVGMWWIRRGSAIMTDNLPHQWWKTIHSQRRHR